MALKAPELKYTRPASPTLLRAHALAAEIDELLAAFAKEDPHARTPSLAYQVRLAKGLTRSLIDQLEELEGAPSSARSLLTAVDAD
jgi:hypothetical protein